MNVKYFINSNKTNLETSNEKFYKMNKYTVQFDKFANNQNIAAELTTNAEGNAAAVAPDENEFKSSVKLSKGVIGYNTFKSIIMHIYKVITNRLVRTAHLSDLSNNKIKGMSG